ARARAQRQPGVRAAAPGAGAGYRAGARVTRGAVLQRGELAPVSGQDTQQSRDGAGAELPDGVRARGRPEYGQQLDRAATVVRRPAKLPAGTTRRELWAGGGDPERHSRGAIRDRGIN